MARGCCLELTTLDTMPFSYQHLHRVKKKKEKVYESLGGTVEA